MTAPFYNDPLIAVSGEGTAPYPLYSHALTTGQMWGSSVQTTLAPAPVISATGGVRPNGMMATTISYPNDAKNLPSFIVEFDLWTGTDTTGFAGLLFNASDNGTSESGFGLIRNGALLLLTNYTGSGTGSFVAGSGSIGFANSTTYTIRVIKSGPVMYFYRNGTLLFQSSSSLFTVGKLGIIMSSGSIAVTDAAQMRISNFKVYEQPAVNVGVSSPNLYFNPGSWRKSGGTDLRTINTGAYCKFLCDSGLIGVGVDTSAIGGGSPTSIGLTYQINDGAWQTLTLSAGQTMFYIATDATPAAPRKIRLEVYTFSGNLRWTTPLIITGFAIEPAKTSSLGTIRPRIGRFYSDSTGEGFNYDGSGKTDFRISWIRAVALVRGLEYGALCFSGQGYGKSGQGAVPVFRQAWNFFYSGQSNLAEPAPDEVWIMQGENDILGVPTADGTVTSEATATYAAMAAQWPNAEFYVVINPSGAKQAALLAATLPGPKWHVITAAADHLSTFFNITGAGTSLTPDGVHPYTHGYGLLASIVNVEAARIAANALAASDIRRNKTVLAVDGLSTKTGTLDVPNRNDVTKDVAVDNTTGTATWPTTGQVVKDVTWIQGGATKTGTVVTSSGYALLPISVVRYGYDRGDGALGDYAIPTEDSVLEGFQFGSSSVNPKVGRYRQPDARWYLNDGPGFGYVANLVQGSAVCPPTQGILTGYVSKRGPSAAADGRYVPPAKSSYLTTGPGYGVDGAETGTASSSGTPSVIVFNRRRRNMIYTQPSALLAAVAIDGTTPVKIFASRDSGNAGWQCSNNTGQTVFFLETRFDEVPNASAVRSAGRKVVDGDIAEGSSTAGAVWAILGAAGNATIYPQQLSKAV